jgi:hypothetical protein
MEILDLTGQVAATYNNLALRHDFDDSKTKQRTLR